MNTEPVEIPEHYSYPDLNPPQGPAHPANQPLPEHFSYRGMDTAPKRPANPRDAAGIPQYFAYRDLDGTRQNVPESPAQATTAAPDDDRQQTPTMDTPSDDSQPEPPETVDSAEWEAELDAGNYDVVGNAVVTELRSLGASDAEASTAANLCNLASERRNDPEWVAWSKSMIKWVRSLRG
jgi:hypothetical protein